MDVHDRLDELTALVESARALPMSGSCVLNRADVLALLDEIQELLPDELRAAELVLEDRDAVLEDGRREADRVLEEAHAERERLISSTEVVTAAAVEAEALRRAAAEEAAATRAEIDDYVDSTLAGFEVTLNKTLAAVHRGRDRLRAAAPTALGQQPPVR